MSWYTRPQDSSLASCKHYLSIINTARTCFCFSLRSTDTHYPSQSSWRLLIDGFGLLMSSTSSWHLHVVFSCVSLASTIWTTWNVPISPGDIWWVQKNHCNSSGTTYCSAEAGALPEAAPLCDGSGKEPQEPVDQASIPSPVCLVCTRSLKLKVLCFLWLLSLPRLPQSVLILIFPSKNFVFIYFILESHAIPSFLNISNHCTFTSVNYTACVFMLNKF